ncbi:MAG: sigma-70 family RNA polymerase sigma factor [Bacteroidetes bacterium]|nr:MAG: sigma-70 family RNA polymerase sigma factor [Bacteroidota bacterium]
MPHPVPRRRPRLDARDAMTLTAVPETPTRPNDDADRDLLARARAGDRQAFRVLVERYQDEIAATVVAMLGPGADVDDVVQDTFIRFYEAMGDFRGEASVRTYLKRIAINRALDVLRRRRRSLARFISRDDEAVRLPEPGRDGEQDIEQSERNALVRRALEALSPRHRAVVVLRLLEGYDTQETAEMLGVPYGTVLSRLNRALKKIQNHLAPYLEGDPSGTGAIPTGRTP